jgi:hypothetical protein
MIMEDEMVKTVLELTGMDLPSRAVSSMPSVAQSPCFVGILSHDSQSVRDADILNASPAACR